MPELILTAEQAKIVSQALGRLTVRDAGGNVLGHIEPELTPEMIAELKHRARSPAVVYGRASAGTLAVAARRMGPHQRV